MQPDDQVEVAELAKAHIFGRRNRHPYYIMAPRFSASSAGNVALYVLCHTLNGIGEEAFVMVDGPPLRLDPAALSGLRAPRLDGETLAAHHAFGRTPVVVCPETFELPVADVIRTVYLLNYLGHLGGPAAFPDCDLMFAYSSNIADRTPSCDLVLHIPVVDASYWTPDSKVERIRPAVYAGKYVDHHGQTLPRELADANVITRYQEDSPDRAQLREIFRSSTCLHIFENTAAAIEAALCECPVICRFNPFFDELISARETGLAGFDVTGGNGSFEEARATVKRFRSDYLRAADGFGPGLLAFVERTQAQAQARVYDRPMRIRGVA